MRSIHKFNFPITQELYLLIKTNVYFSVNDTLHTNYGNTNILVYM